VDDTMFEEQVMPSGADVLVPKWDVIRPRIAQAFANPDIRGESARVSVQNGTTTNGAAVPIQNDIAARGIYVADLSYSPDRGSHPTTTITDYTGGQKPHTIETLARVLGISPADVKQAPASKAPISSTDSKPVDILVTVGDDKVK
jgi:LytR cell envelope-related transcriptional attenuator